MPGGKVVKCYAEEQATRMQGMTERGPGRPYEQGFQTITYHPEELTQIAAKEKPHAIFLDSMSDLFGVSVNREAIAKAIVCATENPRHLILTLTKNPAGLKGWVFPKNWWVGISAPPTEMFGKTLTIDQQRTWLRRALETLDNIDAHVRWLSLEPLSFDLVDILRDHKTAFDWAVVGAGSDGAALFQPDRFTFRDTVKTLRDLNKKIFFKGNIDRKLAEENAGGWLAEFPTPFTFNPELL